MAIKQYGVRTAQNIKTYFASVTDEVESFPTDCAAGSTITIIDKDNHKWIALYSYDGEDWNLATTFD